MVLWSFKPFIIKPHVSKITYVGHCHDWKSAESNSCASSGSGPNERKWNRLLSDNNFSQHTSSDGESRTKLQVTLTNIDILLPIFFFK